MLDNKIKLSFYSIFSATLILIFSQTAVANVIDSIGTGSKGSYDYSADKHKNLSMEKEGSGSKAYSKHKAYSHKKKAVEVNLTTIIKDITTIIAKAATPSLMLIKGIIITHNLVTAHMLNAHSPTF